MGFSQSCDLVSHGLNYGDGDYADDIFCGASAGKIVNRLCDTLKDGSVCICLCQTLYNLVCDVSGIEVDGIQAAYNDGVLTLTMPKKVETAPASRRLEIK